MAFRDLARVVLKALGAGTYCPQCELPCFEFELRDSLGELALVVLSGLAPASRTTLPFPIRILARAVPSCSVTVDSSSKVAAGSLGIVGDLRLS